MPGRGNSTYKGSGVSQSVTGMGGPDEGAGDEIRGADEAQQQQSCGPINETVQTLEPGLGTRDWDSSPKWPSDPRPFPKLLCSPFS